jgi:hypothetical protein
MTRPVADKVERGNERQNKYARLTTRMMPVARNRVSGLRNRTNIAKWSSARPPTKAGARAALQTCWCDRDWVGLNEFSVIAASKNNFTIFVCQFTLKLKDWLRRVRKRCRPKEKRPRLGPQS